MPACHARPISGAIFFGQQLVSVGTDGNVCVWRLETSAEQLEGSACIAADATTAAQQQCIAAAGEAAQQAADWRTALQPARAAGSTAASSPGAEVQQLQRCVQDDPGAARKRRDARGWGVMMQPALLQRAAPLPSCCFA
jgi:hypothetical protein